MTFVDDFLVAIERSTGEWPVQPRADAVFLQPTGSVLPSVRSVSETISSNRPFCDGKPDRWHRDGRHVTNWLQHPGCRVDREDTSVFVLVRHAEGRAVW